MSLRASFHSFSGQDARARLTDDVIDLRSPAPAAWAPEVGCEPVTGSPRAAEDDALTSASGLSRATGLMSQPPAAEEAAPASSPATRSVQFASVTDLVLMARGGDRGLGKSWLPALAA